MQTPWYLNKAYWLALAAALIQLLGDGGANILPEAVTLTVVDEIVTSVAAFIAAALGIRQQSDPDTAA